MPKRTVVYDREKKITWKMAPNINLRVLQLHMRNRITYTVARTT